MKTRLLPQRIIMALGIFLLPGLLLADEATLNAADTAWILTSEEETEGLDISAHEERAYDLH